jgi:dolichol kinase
MPEFVLRLLGRTRTRFFDFCQRVELARKIWHAGSISGVAALNWYLESWTLKLLLIWSALLLAIGYEWLRKRVTIPLVRSLEREHETNGARTTMVDFLVGCALCISLFPDYAVTVALLVTAWCDPAAAFVGQASEVKTRWRHSRKSVEGTFTCAATAFLVAGFCYKMQYWPMLLVCGVLCSVVELKTKQTAYKSGPFKGHLSLADNFFIMLTASVTLSVVELLQRS